ncbi:MAG: rRNA adenine N-6-methyltransferase family protein, partial [Promethearchaeota archaeon]
MFTNFQHPPKKPKHQTNNQTQASIPNSKLIDDTTMPILSQKSLQQLFTQKKFKPSSDAGQTFIVSERLVNAVTKALELKSDEDIILEVGPGFGAFTDRILSKSSSIFLIEKDPTCLSYLHEYLKQKAPVFVHS